MKLLTDEKVKDLYSAPYLLKNTMLGIKSDWMLNKTTWELVKSSMKEIKEFEVNDGKYDLETELTNYPKQLVNDVYSVPLFTQEFCDMLIDEIKNIRKFLSFRSFSASRPKISLTFTLSPFPLGGVVGKVKLNNPKITDAIAVIKNVFLSNPSAIPDSESQAKI